LTGAYGYSFVTGNAIVVIDELGLLSNTPPNGQTVRIYLDSTTTTTNLSSVMIPSNAPVSSPSHGHTYAYEAITPLTLLPNTTYDIVVDTAPGSGININTTTVVNVPDITLGSGRSGADGQFPTDDTSGLTGPYFGPTFDVASITAAPEPASLTLLGLGVAGLAGYAWRRRR
jgi:hypothetical protein